MTAKEAIGNGRLINFILSVAVILGGFVTYKMWPLRERVSIAEQRIETVCEQQKDLKADHKEFVTGKEIKPVLESIQRQLNEHTKICDKQNEQMAAISKLLIKIEVQLEKQ